MEKAPREKDIAKVRTAGFFIKGLVYVLMGVLTFMASVGMRGDVASRDGSVDFLLALPAGKLLGAIVALGLLAYALWRLSQAIFRPKKNGKKPKGIKSFFTRIRFMYSSLLYGFIAYSFGSPLVQDILGLEKIDGLSQDNHQRQAALGVILSLEWGKILIWIIAGIVAIHAIWQFKLAFTKKFFKKIDHDPNSKKEHKLIIKMGQFGYAARGVIFGIISFFLVKVILLHNSKIYRGMEGSMQYLLTFSYGSFLLATVAIGLIAYGIFNIMVSRHADHIEIQ